MNEAPASTLRRNHRSITNVVNVRGTYRDYMNALPHNMQEKLTYNRLTAAKYDKLTRWMNGPGGVILSKQEVKVLTFVAARTLGYGKVAERVLATQFQNGVFQEQKDGTVECVTKRWGGNNRDWYLNVAHLESRGILKVHPVNQGGKKLGTIYEIAIDFTLNLRPSGDSMSALRQPRKATARKQIDSTAEVIDFGAILLAKTGRLDCSKRHSGESVPFVPKGTRELNKGKPELNKLLQTPSAQQNESILATPKRVRRTPRPAVPTTNEIDCNAAIRKAIDTATVSSAERRQQRITDKPATATVTMSELNATWKQAMIDVHGTTSVTGIGSALFGRLRSAMKKHTLTFTWSSFFTWCLESWGAIESNAQYDAQRRRKDGDISRNEATVFLGSQPCLERVVLKLDQLIQMYQQQNGLKVGTHSGRASVDDATAAELAAALAENKILAAYVNSIKETHRKDIAALRSKMGESGAAVPKQRIISPELDTDFDDDDDLPEWKNDE